MSREARMFWARRSLAAAARNLVLCHEAPPATAVKEGEENKEGSGGAQATVEELQANITKLRDENAKRRIKERDAEQKVTALSAVLGDLAEQTGVSVEDLMDPEKRAETFKAVVTPRVAAPAAGSGLPGAAPGQQSTDPEVLAELARTKKAAETANRRLKEITDELAKSKRELSEKDVRSTIDSLLNSKDVRVEDREYVSEIQWNRLVRDAQTGEFKRDDDGRVLQRYRDPKTNEMTEGALSDATVTFNIPPSMMEPAGGPGSGGRPPGAFGSGLKVPKGHVEKALASSKYYREHKADVEAELRGSQPTGR